MATPRSELVDSKNKLHYHCVSRCVRSSWLCGVDPTTGKDYSHRKQMLIDRMEQLAPAFSVAIVAYAIMSNHFHVVLFYDPTAAATWTPEEVVDRWLRAFPPRDRDGKIQPDVIPVLRAAWLENPDAIEHQRETLGSLSMYMKYVKQPISRQANKEDGVSGHFFEQRFYSGALLGQSSLLACCAYVDLNRVRAGIARSLEECLHSSIVARLKQIENTPERLAEAVKPLVSGLEEPPEPIALTLGEYIERLRTTVRAELNPAEAASFTPVQMVWLDQVKSMGKRQRAYGSVDDLTEWLQQRGMRPLERPLPD